MNREQKLRNRIQFLTWLFIVGLVFSGATAIPLQSEVDWLAHATGAEQMVRAPTSTDAPPWAIWLVRVQTALHETASRHPFLFYGTDWLGFGHFVIAVAFVGALRDPIRNRWLFTFGLVACGIVIPYALTFGAVRGIPLWWRLVDCSFGVFGCIPVWLCRKWAIDLELAGNARDHA
jgi:hypothetical protein